MDGELDRTRETMADRGREASRRAQEAAREAGTQATETAREAGGRAQDLARQADERLTRMTGRSTAEWTDRTRTLVREHPLPAIAVALGLGYIVGKIMRR